MNNPESDFSRKHIVVSRGALIQVLTAINGPSHLIRELQVTRGFPLGPENPIDTLINEIDHQVTIFNSLPQELKDHVLVLDQLYKDISKSNELNQEAKARYLNSVKHSLNILLNQK